MTTRLYYTDSFLSSFDATVIACDAAGGRTEVVLDQTAFYPASGGQPFDTGRLGDVHVVEVVEYEDGRVGHVVDGPLDPGAAVRGEIDWPRRFDHMQQHTGQHMLSAAFDRRDRIRTISFHLGAETSTIDLGREATPQEITAAEREANHVIWEDRHVEVRYATEEESRGLSLRKEPTRTGLLRLVDIAGFDISACGGTHVPRTGMVGAIAVTAWERFKGGSRVTFVCGGRALRAFGRLRDTVSEATRTLSVSAAELSPAIDRLRGEARDQARFVRHLQEELAGHRAASLRAEAETIGGYRVVLRQEGGWDAAALKVLAQAIVASPGFVAVLVGGGRPIPVVAARSADVAFDASAWMARAIAALGGKGGGRPELAQGGLPADAEPVLAWARQTVASGG
jgi:alanyl-tRNA synthetase